MQEGSVMSKNQFNQEQKLKILESAKKLGARPVISSEIRTSYGWYASSR